VANTQLVELKLEDGTEILIEGWDLQVEPAGLREPGGMQLLRSPTEAAERVIQTISGYTRLIVKALREATAEATPDKATVSFGVKIGGGYNAAIAQASGEANVTVTAEWNMRSPAPKT
jgi:hypothetical protein